MLEAIRERIRDATPRARCQTVVEAGDVAGHRGETAGTVRAFPREVTLKRRPEQPIATANDGGGVDRIRKTRPRRKLVWLRIALVVVGPVNPGIHEASREVETWHLNGEWLIGRPADHGVVVLFPHPALVLVTEAEVHRQLVADAEIVLDVGAQVVDEHLGLRGHLNVAGRRQPKQVARERVAGARKRGNWIGARGESACELEITRRVARIGEIHTHAPEIERRS